MKESKLVAKIMKFLRTHEGDCYKVHGNMYQRAGEPDLTGSIKWDGHWLHFKLEVKTKGNKPTPLQLHRLASWAKYDKVVGVVHSVAEVIELFDEAVLSRT